MRTLAFIALYGLSLPASAGALWPDTDHSLAGSWERSPSAFVVQAAAQDDAGGLTSIDRSAPLAERKEATAYAAGMAQFVDDHCDTMKANAVGALNVGGGLGIDLYTFANDDALQERKAAIEAELAGDTENNCTLAWERFGPNGTVIPGLIMRRLFQRDGKPIPRP